MRVFGSLNNRIMENVAPQKPVVGMGATHLMYSDRHAYTVIIVHSDKELTLQADKAIRTDNYGMSDAQSYRYEQDPEGATVVITLRKDGRWRQKGDPMKGGTIFMLGERDAHHDYSF